MHRRLAGIAIALASLTPTVAGALGADVVAADPEITDPVITDPLLGPALTTAPEVLDARLSCPAQVGAGVGEPVLLVPGTGGDPAIWWDWSYVPDLTAREMDVCTVVMPDENLGDYQVAAETVVHAVRTIRRRSHERVDVMSFSGGNMALRWALKWWPDVAAATDDAVLLASPSHGMVTAESLCLTGTCPPASWQLRQSSKFVAALNAGDETPGTVDWSSIYSVTDELVQPFTTSPVAGGANIAIQDPCPGKPVNHVGVLHDATTHALVLDALVTPGPARRTAADVSTCVQPIFAGLDPVAVLGKVAIAYADTTMRQMNHPGVAAEPELAPYVK